MEAAHLPEATNLVALKECALESLFSLGQTVMTWSAHETLDPLDVINCLKRHATGDWGEVCEEDFEANQDALKEELRLLSVYTDRLGTKFWIITEWDRSATTVLLPSDY